jgi:hypothetical protein
MPVSISPAAPPVAPNGRLNFSASGGTGPYSFALHVNRSGGSIDAATGAYLAGPHGLVHDVVRVTDSLAAFADATVAVAAGLWQQTQQLIGPPWMKLPNGQIVEGDYGAEKDILFERARQGLMSNMPVLGPADALDLQGQERKLPRAVDISGTPVETDAVFAERLRTQWDADDGWSPASAFAPMLRALDRAGIPMGDPGGAHVIQSYRRIAWLSASGGSPVYGTHPDPWTFSSDPASQWNMFGILFGADVAAIDVGTPATERLFEIVAEWKPGKARFMGIWIIVSGPTWGWPTTVTWGAGGRNWGGGSTRFIPPG